eukprot:ANDGO_06121.mRNA.1 hypothetical protein
MASEESIYAESARQILAGQQKRPENQKTRVISYVPNGRGSDSAASASSSAASGSMKLSQQSLVQDLTVLPDEKDPSAVVPESDEPLNRKSRVHPPKSHDSSISRRSKVSQLTMDSGAGNDSSSVKKVDVPITPFLVIKGVPHEPKVVSGPKIHIPITAGLLVRSAPPSDTTAQAVVHVQKPANIRTPSSRLSPRLTSTLDSSSKGGVSSLRSSEFVKPSSPASAFELIIGSPQVSMQKREFVSDRSPARDSPVSPKTAVVPDTQVPSANESSPKKLRPQSAPLGRPRSPTRPSSPFSSIIRDREVIDVIEKTLNLSQSSQTVVRPRSPGSLTPQRCRFNPKSKTVGIGPRISRPEELEFRKYHEYHETMKSIRTASAASLRDVRSSNSIDRPSAKDIQIMDTKEDFTALSTKSSSAPHDPSNVVVGQSVYDKKMRLPSPVTESSRTDSLKRRPSFTVQVRDSAPQFDFGFGFRVVKAGATPGEVFTPGVSNRNFLLSEHPSLGEKKRHGHPRYDDTDFIPEIEPVDPQKNQFVEHWITQVSGSDASGVPVGEGHRSHSPTTMLNLRLKSTSQVKLLHDASPQQKELLVATRSATPDSMVDAMSSASSDRRPKLHAQNQSTANRPPIEKQRPRTAGLRTTQVPRGLVPYKNS